MKALELILDIASIFLCIFIIIFILLSWKSLSGDSEFEEVPLCPTK